ncbi:MAG: TusE/DsrC/DsvC family sulfur relay protein [Pseudomonadota bacterium]|nr:MAG: TusE/DsrC/DsvC family sulfur relay protein [Pseudomonadota bacterium]
MTIQIGGTILDTDEEGFLLDPAQWNREVAEIIARSERIEMDATRWAVVDFVREHFESRQTVPEARTVLKELKTRFGPQRATRKYMHELFPYGYGQQASKIAGMRKPHKLMLDV